MLWKYIRVVNKLFFFYFFFAMRRTRLTIVFSIRYISDAAQSGYLNDVQPKYGRNDPLNHHETIRRCRRMVVIHNNCVRCGGGGADELFLH